MGNSGGLTIPGACWSASESRSHSWVGSRFFTNEPPDPSLVGSLCRGLARPRRCPRDWGTFSPPANPKLWGPPHSFGDPFTAPLASLCVCPGADCQSFCPEEHCWGASMQHCQTREYQTQGLCWIPFLHGTAQPHPSPASQPGLLRAGQACRVN